MKYRMIDLFAGAGGLSCGLEQSGFTPVLANELGIHRFEALILPDNNPSIHMVEKLGFKFEGILRDKIIIGGERLDHCMYSYLANN